MVYKRLLYDVGSIPAYMCANVFFKGKFSVLVVVYTIVISAIAGFSWVKFVFSIKKKPICKEKW